jgi:hypothetical protein
MVGNGDGDGKGIQESFIDELAIFFEDVVDIASFCTFRMNWPLVGIARMAMAYAFYLFAYKLFVFSRFSCANPLKLASAGQFAGTDQNSLRKQDASRPCACQQGGLDRDVNSV